MTKTSFNLDLTSSGKPCLDADGGLFEGGPIDWGDFLVFCFFLNDMIVYVSSVPVRGRQYTFANVQSLHACVNKWLLVICGDQVQKFGHVSKITYSQWKISRNWTHSWEKQLFQRRKAYKKHWKEGNPVSLAHKLDNNRDRLFGWIINYYYNYSTIIIILSRVSAVVIISCTHNLYSLMYVGL